MGGARRPSPRPSPASGRGRSTSAVDEDAAGHAAADAGHAVVRAEVAALALVVVEDAVSAVVRELATRRAAAGLGPVGLVVVPAAGVALLAVGRVGHGVAAVGA